MEVACGLQTCLAEWSHKSLEQDIFFPGGTSVVQIKMEMGTIIGNYLLLPFPLHSFLSPFSPLALPSLLPLLSFSEEYTCQMFSTFLFTS